MRIDFTAWACYARPMRTLARLLPAFAFTSLSTACDPQPTASDAGMDAALSDAPSETVPDAYRDDVGRDAWMREAMVVGEDVVLEAADFPCILNWTMVRHFRITNVLGHLDETLAVANSPTGGTYPVGTVIQLVPTEAMVKRGRGWNAATNDWEFFALDVTASSTTIRARGAEDTVNAFGGNCFNCHQRADPAFDFICENTHGCDPLPIGLSTILSIQNADPRCR